VAIVSALDVAIGRGLVLGLGGGGVLVHIAVVVLALLVVVTIVIIVVAIGDIHGELAVEVVDVAEVSARWRGSNSRVPNEIQL
jgi:hypothetical protein